MKSRVLFLDYDGVVNTLMWNDKGTRVSYNFPKDNKVNNFQAVQWVSEFCLKCKYDIVVTSSWREDSNYKACLLNGGLKNGIDISGSLSLNPEKTRGELIQEYINSHPEIKYYIIVDDETDILPEQTNRFIKVNPSYGFNEPEYKKCIEIYMKDKSANNG